MIDELHEMGIETMVSIWPQIDWRSENYEEMKQQGLLVKSNAGVDVQMLFHGIMSSWMQQIREQESMYGRK